MKEEVHSLVVSADTLLVANVEGLTTLELESSGNWTASVASTWCTISPKSGSGNATIEIVATDNTGDKERGVFVYITTGSIKKSVYVKQDKPTLYVDPGEISLEKGQGSFVMEVESNTRWKVEIPDDVSWLTADPPEGTGNAEVHFSYTENDGGVREASVKFIYARNESAVQFIQSRGRNMPPDVVLLDSPVDSKADADRLSTFRWFAADDPDGDSVYYKLQYGHSVTAMDYSVETDDTLYNLPEYLSSNMRYYWRVIAMDEFGEESVSETRSFTTGEKQGYFDGEYRLYQEHSKGAVPSRIIFTGDGYLSDDHEEGGKFDSDLDEGIEAFFAVEPYKSYRDYFTLYKMAAYSRESGVSQSDKSISRDTRFSTSFLGGSSLGVETEDVFSHIRQMEGMTDEALRNTLIVVVINQDRYAGTCWMWSDGRAIALVPVSRSGSPGSHYSNLMNHEAGGHGFGRLADEYVNSDNMGKTITDTEKEKLTSFESKGFYRNVSLTDDRSQVKWRHFFPIEGYERVGLHEGAFYFSYGAWRPESSSCMVHNEKYYNAPSREAIVRRIFETAGVEYTLNAFIGKDVQKAPSAAAAAITKSINPLTFVPLAPPVIVE
jgi:hypothetical protein